MARPAQAPTRTRGVPSGAKTSPTLRSRISTSRRPVPRASEMLVWSRTLPAVAEDQALPSCVRESTQALAAKAGAIQERLQPECVAIRARRSGRCRCPQRARRLPRVSQAPRRNSDAETLACEIQVVLCCPTVALTCLRALHVWVTAPTPRRAGQVERVVRWPTPLVTVSTAKASAIPAVNTFLNLGGKGRSVTTRFDQ